MLFTVLGYLSWSKSCFAGRCARATSAVTVCSPLRVRGGFSHVGYFALNCRYGILVPSSNLISALLRELKMQDSAAKIFKHRKR